MCKCRKYILKHNRNEFKNIQQWECWCRILFLRVPPSLCFCVWFVPFNQTCSAYLFVFLDVLYFMFSFLPYVDPWSGSQPCNMLSLWLMKRGQKCAVRPLCGFMGESYFHSPSLKAQNERAWRYSRSVWSLLYSEVKGDWTVKKKRHNEEQSLNGDRLALLCDLRELI